MKSVMLSIQPKWCELIASGKKTIEVRKSAPKLETPFKCYIYCTKDKYQHLYDLRPYTNGEISLSLTQHNKTSLVPQNYWNGKVIGEFVCNKILEYECSSVGHGELATTCGTCLTYDDIINYCNGKTLYGWHISDLKIYDKPKELSEFRKWCHGIGKCSNCSDNVYWGGNCDGGAIEKAPQSWGYCKEL